MTRRLARGAASGAARRAAPVAALAAACLLAGAAAPGPYTGKYESGWNRVPTVELLVKQEGSKLRGAATLVVDHRGTQVLTVQLTGRVVGRAGNFAWTDSFGNAGTASLYPDGADRWTLLSVIRKPTDDGRWFEGRYALTKTQATLAAGEEP